MDEKPWQFRLVNKSLKKKEKLRHLDRPVAPSGERAALDLGCAQGMLSYYTRRRGGLWVSADRTSPTSGRPRLILGPGLSPSGGRRSPSGMARSILSSSPIIWSTSRATPGPPRNLAGPQSGRRAHRGRALRPGGSMSSISSVRLGMRLEDYGHRRRTTLPPSFKAKLERAGLQRVESKTTYSRFFSELFELRPELRLHKSPRQRRPAGSVTATSGPPRPRSSGPENTFRPVLPTVSRRLAPVPPGLLFFFQKGYSLIVCGRRNAIKRTFGNVGVPE